MFLERHPHHETIFNLHCKIDLSKPIQVVTPWSFLASS